MTSFAYQLRQALISTFDSSVGPVLLDLEAKANTQERANLAAHWKQRHAGAVAEARRQEHRAALLAEALGNILRKFPKRDRTKHAWEDRLIVSHSVYRDDLARWGQLIPDSRRGRDWRRNTVLRTKRDATNRERAAAQSAASKAREEARNAVELHRQELRARSEAEIGWRAALAEVERLKAELGEAPQQIARLNSQIENLHVTLDRQMTAHGERIRQHQETKRRHASTIRQAQREHHRAERLAAERAQLVADLDEARTERDGWHGKADAWQARAGEHRRNAQRFLTELAALKVAAGGREGAQQRLCGATIGNPVDPNRSIGPCIRPAGHADPEHAAADGVKWTFLMPQSRAEQAAPCWCGHDPDAHVTDAGDNAVCRACWGTPNFHQAHHVHAPEQP